MPIDESTTFEVSTRGHIESDVIERARERLGRVGRHCREAVTHAELRVTDDAFHPDQPHATAEATLVVKHGPVRAHARAATAGEAVDAMIDRLRRRVDRHESKLHRIGSKKHTGVATPGTWRHGDVDSAPRQALPPMNSEAKIVRRKSFATDPMSVEEAVFDIGILDHAFYLFEEIETGSTCLLVGAGEQGLELAVDGDVYPALPAEVAIRAIDGPVVMDTPGAVRLLTATADPFVFYRPTVDVAPQVLYRRYDGQLGVIDLAPSRVGSGR